MTIDVRLSDDKVISISYEEHARALAKVISEFCDYNEKQKETIFDFLFNCVSSIAYDKIAEDFEDRLQEELEEEFD